MTSEGEEEAAPGPSKAEEVSGTAGVRENLACLGGEGAPGEERHPQQGGVVEDGGDEEEGEEGEAATVPRRKRRGRQSQRCGAHANRVSWQDSESQAWWQDREPQAWWQGRSSRGSQWHQPGHVQAWRPRP